MDAKWLWLGLLALVCFFAFIAWRKRIVDPIPPLIMALQVACAVGLAGYTAYRFVA